VYIPDIPFLFLTKICLIYVIYNNKQIYARNIKYMYTSMLRKLCKISQKFMSHKFQNIQLRLHLCFKSCTLVPDNDPWGPKHVEFIDDVIKRLLYLS
jgi:hypothetical protein